MRSILSYNVKHTCRRIFFHYKSRIWSIFFQNSCESCASHSSIFFQENYLKDINYFKKKNKIDIELISDNTLSLSDYTIDFLSKTKKVIEKIEKISHLNKVILNKEQNNNIRKNSGKKKFKKKKYYKKILQKKTK